MAQYNITVNDEVLKDLFSGDGGISKLLEQVLNQVLQAQAMPYERSEERQDYRNGIRGLATDEPCIDGEIKVN
jgi:putative transposase